MCSKYANHSRLISHHDRAGPIQPLSEHENLYFDKELSNCMRSKFEANGCTHDLDMLTISY
jgi:hypothetical protein